MTMQTTGQAVAGFYHLSLARQNLAQCLHDLLEAGVNFAVLLPLLLLHNKEVQGQVCKILVSH